MQLFWDSDASGLEDGWGFWHLQEVKSNNTLVFEEKQYISLLGFEEFALITHTGKKEFENVWWKESIEHSPSGSREQKVQEYNQGAEM